MKKTRKKLATARLTERMVRTDAIRERLYWAAAHEEAEILKQYGTPGDGLTPELARRSPGSLRDKPSHLRKAGVRCKAAVLRLYQPPLR